MVIVPDIRHKSLRGFAMYNHHRKLNRRHRLLNRESKAKLQKTTSKLDKKKYIIAFVLSILTILAFQQGANASTEQTLSKIAASSVKTPEALTWPPPWRAIALVG